MNGHMKFEMVNTPSDIKMMVRNNSDLLTMAKEYLNSDNHLIFQAIQKTAFGRLYKVYNMPYFDDKEKIDEAFSVYQTISQTAYENYLKITKNAWNTYIHGDWNRYKEICKTEDLNLKNIQTRAQDEYKKVLYQGYMHKQKYIVYPAWLRYNLTLAKTFIELYIKQETTEH
jgi:hypothetical protein